MITIWPFPVRVFLDAPSISTRGRVRPLVRPSVGPSVRPSVRHAFVKIAENGVMQLCSSAVMRYAVRGASYVVYTALFSSSSSISSPSLSLSSPSILLNDDLRECGRNIQEINDTHVLSILKFFFFMIISVYAMTIKEIHVVIFTFFYKRA